MATPYRQTFQTKPREDNALLDLGISDPKGGPQDSPNVPSATINTAPRDSNPLVDAARARVNSIGSGDGGWRVERVSRGTDFLGNEREPSLRLGGATQLPKLDFSGVAGGIRDSNLYQGSAQAARAYRNPYEQKLQLGAGWNPIQNRGVGARGIVGEQMQAQREGRTADPIMGRTQSYTEDPHGPVDHRPTANTPTEAAFWANRDRINKTWKAGGYPRQGVDAGIGPFASQDGPGEMPPRLERTSRIGYQGSRGSTGNSDNYEQVHPDWNLPEDVLWEEAWEGTNGGDNHAKTEWLIRNKNLDPEVAAKVAYFREIDQITNAIQHLNQGRPLKLVDPTYAPNERERYASMEFVGWDEIEYEDRQAMRLLIAERQALQLEYLRELDKFNIPHPYGIYNAPGSKHKYGQWRRDLDAKKGQY